MAFNPHKLESEDRRNNLLLSLVIFVVTLAIFLLSPVRSLGETQYTMMVAYSLLHHRTFALDRDQLRLPDHVEMIDRTKVKYLPLEIVNDRVYKYAPPGTSVLAVPFVATVGVLGLSPVDSSGEYDQRAEVKMMAILGAVLMGGFASICFLTSRVLLPISWSLIITCVAAFGTQVWSTASRVVEPESWTVVLLMVALYLIVACDVANKRLRPVLLATVLSWCYFVHPTSSISIIAISIYLGLYHRRQFPVFALTGAVWFCLLLVYSWHNFGQFLPNYYQASRLGFETFWEAFAGNLVSPARGLFVYVPVTIILIVLLLKYRSSLPLKPLVIVACAVLFVHLLIISGFNHWWAGHSYGPRYWTSMVPWISFLCAAGINGRLDSGLTRTVASRVGTGVGAVFALLSIVINAHGALSDKTRLWNAKPYDIDLKAGRLWNWRYPQFLAGLVHPPLPAGAYSPAPLNQRIQMANEQVSMFLWYGWSNAEPPIRWRDEKEAAVVFALDNPLNLTLTIKASPFLVAGRKDTQRVLIKLNAKEVARWSLSNGSAAEFAVPLPRDILRRENVITFEFPDADSPYKLGISPDERLLGLAVEWFEFTAAAER